MTRTPQPPKTSKAYEAARFATLKEARALKVGDIIKAFYVDTEETSLLIVSASYCTAKSGNSGDIHATPLEAFGSRTRDYFGPRSLNTDKWVRISHGADVVAMLTRHAQQQEGLLQLVTILPSTPSPRRVVPELYVHTAKGVTRGEPADRLFVIVQKDPDGSRIGWKCIITKDGIVHPGYKDPLTVAQLESGIGTEAVYPNKSTPTAWFTPDSLYLRVSIREVARRINKK